jgi:hypothetical protein
MLKGSGVPRGATWQVKYLSEGGVIQSVFTDSEVAADVLEEFAREYPEARLTGLSRAALPYSGNIAQD